MPVISAVPAAALKLKLSPMSDKSLIPNLVLSLLLISYENSIGKVPLETAIFEPVYSFSTSAFASEAVNFGATPLIKRDKVFTSLSPAEFDAVIESV